MKQEVWSVFGSSNHRASGFYLADFTFDLLLGGYDGTGR
jgi:hypothetical protein